MIILGIHDGHNATASLLKDGEVVACASEERFSRIKNDLGYPVKAINQILSECNIKPEEIDLVALCTKEHDPWSTIEKREALFTIKDYVSEMHEYWKPLLFENRTTNFHERLMDDPRFKLKDSIYNVELLKKTPKENLVKVFNDERVRIIVDHLKIPKEKIHMVDHHTAHAHYAYFASPHGPDDNAVVITADSWGDGCNATISIIENGGLKEVRRTAMCNIARIYRWTTLILGMKPNEHEYKVMGLAPYAKNYIREPAYKIYKEILVVDGLDFKWDKKPSDMYFYFRDKFEGLRFDGIAGGVQLWMEDLLSEWMTNIMKHFEADTVYFSGGLAMNVKANKVVAELPLLKKLYVPASGSDESLAIGAAFFLAKQQKIEPIPPQHVYLGHLPSKEEAEDAVKPFRNDQNYKVIDNPDADLLADLLISGKVLGRCVGKMEFGARSLGNRAILCDPSKPENLKLINEKIKFRDFWMPFTPSILAERADDYLVNPKNNLASYMTLAFDSTPLGRDHLKAAIHPYDFTVRPQLVSAATNKDYHDLIKAFERRTGIGAVLNTSLNLHGSPVVCTANDAIDTMVRSGLDGMILPGVLILKQT